jgi:peptidyl-prolyl cis-trans isomerase C
VRAYFKTVLREPLLHFLLAGLVIFLIFGSSGTDRSGADRIITVDEAKVSALAAQWTQTWQRPPNATELDGVIRDYIKEEVYYREALRLGLDTDDAVVRRRLRSKMEFLATSEVENATPTDAELQKWFDTHRAAYVADLLLTFDQVYVNATAGISDATARAISIRDRLNSEERVNVSGDPLSLPHAFKRTGISALRRQFGEEFAASIVRIPPGKWAGPIKSGFGLHVVRVGEVAASHAPTLVDVRKAVENDWRATTGDAREQRAYQTLLDGYTIRIASPK